MENLEKGNYKKNHVPRLPHVLHVQVFPFLVGRRAVGWLLVVVYWNPVSISESWSPFGDAVSSAGYIQRYFFMAFR